MSRLARALAALAVGLAAACAAQPPPPPRAVHLAPRDGGPPWLELTSDHFVLRTNIGEARARALVDELEDFRAVLAAYYPLDPRVTGRRATVAELCAPEPPRH